MAAPGQSRLTFAFASLTFLLVAGCHFGLRPHPLIPRHALFAEPARYQIRLSPDGRSISFLAPVDGVMSLWIAPRASLISARAMTTDAGKLIAYHQWMADGHTILLLESELGTETSHLMTLDVTNGAVRDLTPFPGVQAELIAWSYDHPDDVLIGINARNPSWHDVYRVKLSTGAATLVERNPGFAQYVADNELRLRYAVAPTRDGGLEVYVRQPAAWKLAETVPPADALSFRIVDFDRSNERLFMIDSRGRDHAALTRFTPATGATEILGADADVDVDDFLLNPLTSSIQAYQVDSDRRSWKAIDASITDDLATLSAAAGPQGTFDIVNRTGDDRTWVVHIARPTQAGIYYLYDRQTKALTAVPTRPELEKARLNPMYSAWIKSRDGLPLLVYYTLGATQDPDGKGKPTHRAPLVVAVHSGPWARDEYGFNLWHQWLADRGYAVISVNYRGSTGFGKAFLNAADGEWGAGMQNDLADAVSWAVKQGIADKSRVAIMGSQYGGYAALAGLAFTPKTYACGISFGGPSNLVHMLQAFPPSWISMRDMFLKRVGDPATPAGRAQLESVSPALRASDIERPLLIAQGINDPFVSAADTETIVRALKEKDVPVTYVRYPDESGKLSHPGNMLSFYAIAEGFLGHCLGGRVEPMGSDLNGSSVEIVEGAPYVPGLISAMAAISQPQR